jgi:DNA-binding transcriptional regulator YdaS (Cro superfamily)
MTLDQYLSSPDALSITELRLRMRSLGYAVKSNAQLRQWQHAYGDRAPSPENCVGLELATGGAISRKDLRPDDWWLLWPELDGAEVERMKSVDDTQPPTGGFSEHNKMARIATA